MHVDISIYKSAWLTNNLTDTLEQVGNWVEEMVIESYIGGNPAKVSPALYNFFADENGYPSTSAYGITQKGRDYLAAVPPKKSYTTTNNNENAVEPNLVEKKLKMSDRPSFSKAALSQVLSSDVIDKFIELENRLIDDGYFNEHGKWIKTSDECAAFINKLIVRRYFLQKRNFETWITKTCKPFFENRYQILFTRQMQYKYRNSNKLAPYFRFIEELRK